MTAPDLRAIRTRLGLSQAELGARLRPPVEQPTVARWESGERRIPAGLWQALETVEREMAGAA